MSGCKLSFCDLDNYVMGSDNFLERGYNGCDKDHLGSNFFIKASSV